MTDRYYWERQSTKERAWIDVLDRHADDGEKLVAKVREVAMAEKIVKALNVSVL